MLNLFMQFVPVFFIRLVKGYALLDVLNYALGRSAGGDGMTHEDHLKANGVLALASVGVMSVATAAAYHTTRSFFALRRA